MNPMTERSAFAAVIAFALFMAGPAGAASPSRLSDSDFTSLRARVAQHAAAHGVPTKLAHAVVMLESRYRPRIVHRGNFGLMQIRYGTARAMGYRGPASGLLDAETNLRYGMRYLARGWKATHGDVCRTIAHYQTGRLVRSLPAVSKAYCARARGIMAGG